MLFDLKNLTIAKIYSDKSFDILVEINSIITSAHRQGGQSSQRFERSRDNLITLWFKKINEILNNVSGDIIIGSHDFYQNRFESILSNDNKNKIKEFFNSEYCDISGVYQYLNK